MNIEQRERYVFLRDAVLDRTATQDEIDELQTLLASSNEFLDDYIEHAHQESSLAWDAHPTTSQPSIPVSSAPDHPNWLWRYMPLIAASLIFIAAVGWEWTTLQPQPVATILSSTNCQWGNGTLPTSVGQELTSGRLRLISGIAEIQFPKVTVSMEGPVDIELISSQRCRLHSGSIVGSVAKGGEGFVVETPRAEIIDRGTKFGVFVDSAGDARLDLMEGKMDVKHLTNGRQMTLDGSGRAYASEHELETISRPTNRTVTDQRRTDRSNGEFIHISSAYGNGDEGDVTSGPRLEGNDFPRPDDALLVKHSAESPEWNRKAFIRFDLSGVTQSDIGEAELRLEGIATGMGYLSLVPDSQFKVFGIRPEHNIPWDSQDLHREHFPGRRENTYQLDDKKIELLGEFTVPQSKPVGQFVLQDERLKDFIQQAIGSTATVVITRVTPNAPSQSYVHGFATRTHPTANPPMLRLHVTPTTAD
ncbi:FecR family protein [Rhodopirellula sp. JC737]|nr:FecR family protein [Rhodopirellula sp. JC737]